MCKIVVQSDLADLEKEINELIKKGHQLKRVDDPYMDFGAGQFIWRLSNELEDGYVAASDSRRDGHAASY